MSMFNPFVYWAQNDKYIYLKVELLEVENPSYNFEDNLLEFSCSGKGAQGKHDYKFSLNFYNSLNFNNNCFKISDKEIKFVIPKSEHNWWPRLLSSPQKPHWLKIDFDRWKSPDDLTDEEQVGDIMKNHGNIFDQLQKDEIGYKKEDSRKVYLIGYNFIMLLGFLYITVVLSIKYLKDGKNSTQYAFSNVSIPILILQVMQFMEVIHPLIGITKGGVLMPFLQITGRLFNVFLLYKGDSRVHSNIAIFYLLIVWCLIELIRYPLYISQLQKRNNELLTWLRYNAWIILYPIGFVCELILCYKNLEYFDETQKFSISMPNSSNFTFNLASFLRIYLLFIAVPGMISLLSHMYRLRKKKFAKNIKHN